MRVRKVVTRRGRHIRGYFPSRKLGRMVAWESLLEKDALLLMELSPGVVSYQEQPEELTYWDGQAMCTYVPDLKVTFQDGTFIFVEIKPLGELDRPAVKAKYTRIAESLQAQGKNFLILTETEIRQLPLFKNLQSLLYGYNHTETLPTSSAITKFFREADQQPLQTCFEHFGKSETHALIGHGLLVADLNSELHPLSPLSFLERGRNEAVYF